MGARYSRHAGYTVARRQTSSRSATRTVKRRVSFGPATARYIGFGVLAAIALLIATMNSGGVAHQYNDEKTNQQLSQVDASNEALRLEAQRAESLSSAATSSKKDSMQPMGSDVKHVAGGEVAGATTATANSTAKNP
jgi:hypothetical protein